MKVSELEGRRLDYWVLRVNGHESVSGLSFDAWMAGKNVRHCKECGTMRAWFDTDPSTSWLWAGNIIERERMMIQHDQLNGGWIAAMFEQSELKNGGTVTQTKCLQSGDTLLVAAMRCYVASKFGDTVDEEKAAA